MKLVVLVPTHHKTIDEIKSLYKFLNLKSDAIFANQNGNNEVILFSIDNHNIRVVNTNTVGVSINRNILLNNVEDEIYLCTDDDCVLCDNYEKIVLEFFKKYNPEFVLFNGLVPYEGNRKVHSKKTKRVNSFFDISYAGGPGFAFTGKAIKKYSLSYNEQVGYPNYIYAGEDTLMYMSVVKTKALFYRSSDIIFSVDIDKEDNSSYFKGFSDQFFITKGANYKTIFPKLYILITRYYAFKLSKRTKRKYKDIMKLFKVGFKYAEENFK